MANAYDINKGRPFASPTVNTATTNPGATNDITTGVSIGDIWINTSAATAYVCINNVAANATWTRFSSA